MSGSDRSIFLELFYMRILFMFAREDIHWWNKISNNVMTENNLSTEMAAYLSKNELAYRNQNFMATKKIIGKTDVSDQFRKIIIRQKYAKIRN